MIEQLRAQIAQLSRQITEQQQPVPQLTKKKLPDPERYDGEEKAKYPSFETNLEAKLALDEAMLGSRANNCKG